RTNRAPIAPATNGCSNCQNPHEVVKLHVISGGVFRTKIARGSGLYLRISIAMSDKCRVLVTGADGFVGRHLVPFLAGQGYTVVAASRAAAPFEDANIISVKLPDLSRPFDWAPLLAQCDVVVHLAGIAHNF